ncbi:MAG: acetylxylan esterase, partial [Armatimonadota bacterium]|nr:acetylxylan esterase [Armatimonadota bacterium]
FESRPNTFVTANLYLPDGITEPRGAVLFLCGHHQQAKHEPEYQIVCQYLVRAGLVVLAMDPVGQGERFSYYNKETGKSDVAWGVMEHGYAGAQCLPLGDALARYFVHDGMRGVDYLMSRSEVDPNKIGVTGNSGGGTQTSLMMICDPRIAAAAPGTFIMNRRSFMYLGGGQDAEQIWPGMTALGFDHEDILLMMPPKPVRVLAVTWDFFPIEGTRRTVNRCKRIWEICGKGGFVDLVEDESIHKFTRPLAKAAAEFFSLHLLGQKVSPDDDGVEEIEPSKLCCTTSGQVREEIAGARFIHDENADRLAKIEKQRDSMRKEEALEWLRKRVFAYRKPCDLNPRRYRVEEFDALEVEMYFWWAQEGIINQAFVFKSKEMAGQDLPVTIAIWDGGATCLQPHIDWITKTCADGRAVMVLDVSGAGSLLPYPLNGRHKPLDYYGAVFKLTDDLLWLNDSLCAMRVYDVLRALDVVKLLHDIKSDNIRFYAHGRQGVYAQFAAALDERVKGIEIVDSMGNYANWVGSRIYDSQDIVSVILPGMLRYFDLPDLDRWFLERK